MSGIAAGLATVVLTFDAAPVEAAMLSGSISFSGNVTFGSTAINPAADSLTFVSAGVDDASGDFTSLITSTPTVTRLDLTLSNDLDSDDSDNFTTGIYTFDATAPFINFGNFTFGGNTGDLIFNLDEGFVQRSRISLGGLFTIFQAGGIQGQFVFDGETLAIGSLSATLAGSSDSYTISLTAAPIPEPMTILGTILAGGMGYAMKRRFNAARDGGN